MRDRAGLPLGLAPPLDPDDELPLQPIILRWIGVYVAAPVDGRDAVVAAILRDWNAMLCNTKSCAGPPRRGSR